MSGLDGCKRCPTCHLAPKMSMEHRLWGGPGQDCVLRCERHGFVAQGDTLEMAVKNWNAFIGSVAA